MKKLLSVILAIIMVLSLCACGASSQANDCASPTPAEAPAAAEKYSSEAGSNYGGLAVSDTAEATTASGSTAPSENPDKIIYSSDVNVETTEFDESVEKLSEMVKEYDGWVESSSISGADYYSKSHGYSGNRSASYSLRIPSSKFSELMNSLSTLGNVPYSYTYTENVTSQYYDAEARLTAYTTQEARLLEMMEKAETVSDVIAIEEKLTELRYQIESIQTSLKNWDRQVSYSTVHLNIQEVTEYTPESEISFGQELWMSLKNGLTSTGYFFRNLLMALVSALPAIIIIAVLLVIFIPIIKKSSKKRRAKKQDRGE